MRRIKFGKNDDHAEEQGDAIVRQHANDPKDQRANDQTQQFGTRRIEADEKTAGGIIIPDTAKEKPQEGEVIAVGPGARDESGKLVELDVTVGDRILFGKWSGTEIKLNGEDLLIMKESDVMGVIEAQAALKKAA